MDEFRPESPPNKRLAAISIGGAVTILGGLLAWGVLSSNVIRPSTPPSLESDRPPPDALLFPDVLSVTDAVAYVGTWFVLDARGRQVHQISPSEGLLQSFGREGSGPGEFTHPVSIVAHGDSIVVVEDGIVHLFSTHGEHIKSRRFSLGRDVNCLVGFGAVEDAVSSPAGLLLLVDCLNQDGAIISHAAIDTGDGVRSIAHREAEPGVIALRDMVPILATHPQGFLFGSAYDTCLDLIDPSGLTRDTVCHGGLEPVPFPKHNVSRDLC